LSFVYGGDDKRHVLIDFGTTGLPKRGKTKVPKVKDYMPTVARDIANVCGAQGLTAVVATHRHADHISGFGTNPETGNSGSTIQSLKPKLVLLPWTEDPDAKRDARRATRESSRSRKGFVAGLAAMHLVAQQIADIAADKSKRLSVAMRKELSFLGSENIANRSAVESLIKMGTAKGATARYLRFGSPSGLERLLPGVKVHVLGPPDLTQSEKIRKMRKRDPDQFWHLLASGVSQRARDGLTSGISTRGAKSPRAVPAEARWFRNRMDRLRAQSLLEIVRSLDDQMNNTSLILLFEVLGKKLLFPGDAQIENWSFALEDADDAKKIRALLADVDVYKVGHHGSLNATPRKLLWERFRKRQGKQLKTLLSTLPGKHGKTQSRTEVPRRTLLTALRNESQLKSTTDLKFGVKPELANQITIEP
jgi:hypothetical protein